MNADSLETTLHRLRLTGTFYCRAELSAPWGVELPAFDDGRMTFLIVTSGECWLSAGRAAPKLLRQGSLALLPRGSRSVVKSSKSVAVRPLERIPVEKISEQYERMRHGGGGAVTHVTCGVVRFDDPVAERLVNALPDVLLVDGWAEGEWLESTLRLIAREASALRLGGETVLTRLADVLVIQAIRSWLDTAPERGWLAALRDEQIGKALALIHRQPEKPWTNASLARQVAMSRSAFAAKFTELVDESVMAYLTRWRMQVARSMLLESDESLATIAERSGYQSEAAFGRAYRRTFGASPGSVRRAARS